MVECSMKLRAGHMSQLAGVALVSLCAVTAVSAAQKQFFNIPAEDASEAMQELARQSGLQVMSPNNDLAGVRTKAIHGTYEPIEALRQMFAGTDISVVQAAENAVTLVHRQEATVPQAKADVPQLEEIIVTGSRIARAGFDTLQAATVEDHSQMDRRGYTNAAQALESNPLFGASDASASGTSQTPSGTGQAFVNLFGLGSQRTLTLVNGRRFVSSNSAAAGGVAPSGQQVDINLIPVGLIDHIETIAIGGAPVYGSDAIAGTVNIILKDNFEGAQVTGQYGIAEEHGDARSYTARVLAGHNFADNRANVTVAGEYDKQDGLLLPARVKGFPFQIPNPANTSDTDGIPALLAVPDLRFGVFTAGGLPYADHGAAGLLGFNAPGLDLSGFGVPQNYIVNAQGVPLQFVTGGKLAPYNVGTIVNNPLAALGGTLPLETAGGDGFNLADTTSLLTPTTRTLINTLAHFDLTPNVRAFFEGSFAHTHGVRLSDLSSFSVPGLLGGPELQFSVDNPFLDPSARSTLQANGLTTFYMTRAFQDIVDRRPQRTDLSVYRVVAGFSGKFTLADQNWKWDVSYNYGRSHNESTLTFVDPTRLLAAANAVRDASGNIVCASPAPAGCVPINLFGLNSFSSAAADYVSTPATSVSLNTQRVATANVGGRLPFGIVSEKVAVNVGAEHRIEAASFEPDANLQLGNTLLGPETNAYEGVRGSFNTKEFYGELEVPVVAPDTQIPGVKMLTLESAARYVDNSIAGSATTWSAGGRIAPRLSGIGDGLMFRGVYTRSIRAPAVTELFLGSSPVLESVADPCDANNYNRGNNPAVRAANCAAALAAAGAPAPGSFVETTNIRSALGAVSGNPQLRNEVAKSWSAGFVYQPAVAPNFHLAVDWTDIRLTGGIAELGISDLLASCYDSTDFAHNPACNAARRLTAADIASGNGTNGLTRAVGDIADGFNQGFLNTASLQFAGLITAAQYDFALSALSQRLEHAGAMRLGMKMFYTSHFDRVDFNGQSIVYRAGTVGLPRYKVQANVGYTYGPFDTDWQVLYRTRSKYDLSATYEDTPINDVPSYTLVNASFGLRLGDHVGLQLAVNNVFDKAPPYSAVMRLSTTAFDFIGRSYLLRATASL